VCPGDNRGQGLHYRPVASILVRLAELSPGNNSGIGSLAAAERKLLRAAMLWLRKSCVGKPLFAADRSERGVRRGGLFADGYSAQSGDFQMNTLGKSAVILTGLVLCASAAGCGGSDIVHLRSFLMQPRAPVSATEYRVLPPDRIVITSQHVVDINGLSMQIGPDGKVNLPLIGEIYVADHTPKEIEEILKKAATKYYEEVDATVTVGAYASRKIYVFGQVGRPGPLPYTGADTLMDVLAMVQPTPLAWPERIKIVRGGGPMRGGFMPLDRDQALKAEVEAEMAKDKAAAAILEPAAATPTGTAASAATTPTGTAAPAAATPTGTAAPLVQTPTGAAAPLAMTPTGTDVPVPPERSKDAGSEGTLAKVKTESTVVPSLTPLQKEEFTESMILTINMMDMVKKGDLSFNILLKPDDVIYVPANPLAEVGLALQMLLFPIQPAISTVASPASAAAAVGTGGAIR